MNGGVSQGAGYPFQGGGSERREIWGTSGLLLLDEELNDSVLHLDWVTWMCSVCGKRASCSLIIYKFLYV